MIPRKEEAGSLSAISIKDTNLQGDEGKGQKRAI